MVSCYGLICSFLLTGWQISVEKMTQNPSQKQVILASQSPIRKTLLAEVGLRFVTRPAFVDEAGLIALSKAETPERIALNLAAAKASLVAAAEPEALVIGADQLLVLDGAILQKPVDMAAARQRLKALSGTIHHLVTGVVLVAGDTVLFSHAETARLTMHALSDEEIDHALAMDGEAVLQSVGAYRLEGPGINLFAALEGDYFSMLGLPLVPLLGALRRHAGPIFRET